MSQYLVTIHTRETRRMKIEDIQRLRYACAVRLPLPPIVPTELDGTSDTLPETVRVAR